MSQLTSGYLALIKIMSQRFFYAKSYQIVTKLRGEMYFLSQVDKIYTILNFLLLFLK